MAKRNSIKSIIKDISIVGVGVLVIWTGLLIGLGAQYPLYVVASGSMIPVLEVNDVIVVKGGCFDIFNILNSNCIRLDWLVPFDDIEIEDIIVFNKPTGNDRVIVHRVVSIINDDPKTIRTQGDANAGSIPGTDFPITEEEYIGKVIIIIPQVGLITKILAPPYNYIIIAMIVGIMVIKQFSKNKEENKNKISDLDNSENTDAVKELLDINKMRKDSEYSEHVEKLEILEDKKDESVKEDKTDDISEKENKE